MDRLERAAKDTQEEDVKVNDEVHAATGEAADQLVDILRQQEADEDSGSYEEVEVTDDEGAEQDNEENGDISGGRKIGGEDKPEGPVDFNEEDIAYQLEQMGQEYGLDPGEYGDGDEEDYDQGLPLTEDDSLGLFRDLLDDYQINPYSTWEKIIDEGRIIEDDRYVVLPNMRARKEAFSSWSTERIQALKEKRAQEERKDPRIGYLKFLHEHATPKLYWPEFKRKFKKENDMRDSHFADKDREKLYREHMSRVKLSETTRKSDLKNLLKSMPARHLHRETTLDALPSSILVDLRFISLPPKQRDSLVEAFIATLPSPSPADDENSGPLSAEEQADLEKRKSERERREKALRDRELKVQEEKRRQRGAMRHGKELMMEGEAELKSAMRVGGGTDVLRGYMEAKDTNVE